MDLKKGPAAGVTKPVLIPSLTAVETVIVSWAVSLSALASALQYSLGLKSLSSWFIYFFLLLWVRTVTVFAVLHRTIYGSFISHTQKIILTLKPIVCSV